MRRRFDDKSIKSDASTSNTTEYQFKPIHARSSKVISPSTFSDTVEYLLADVDFDIISPLAPEPFELCERWTGPTVDRVFVLWPRGIRPTRVMVVLGFMSCGMLTLVYMSSSWRRVWEWARALSRSWVTVRRVCRDEVSKTEKEYDGWKKVHAHVSYRRARDGCGRGTKSAELDYCGSEFRR